MPALLEKKVIQDYWVKKITSVPTSSTLNKSGEQFEFTRFIHESNVDYFLQITAGSALSELAVCQALFHILLSKYFKQYNGCIVCSKMEESSAYTAGTSHHLFCNIGDPYEIDVLSVIKMVKEELQISLAYKDFDHHGLQEVLNGLGTNFTHCLNYGISYNQTRTILSLFSTVRFRLYIERQDDGFLLALTSDMAIIDPFVANQFLGHFERLMVDLERNLRIPCRLLELLSEKEKIKLFSDFDGLRIPFPDGKTMVDLFEDQVRRTPGQAALRFADQQYSYEALNRNANRLAWHLLKEHHVSSNQIIALMLPKSDSAIIAILGILKSGAAYLPIAIDYPQKRVDYILKDSGVNIVLTRTQVQLPFVQGLQRINIDELDLCELSDADPRVAISSSDLAYVIYTSGSTGLPKGVMIEHRSNINMSLDQIRIFGVTATDRVLLFASLSFDASVSEIFMALYCGACLVVPEEEALKDTDKLIKEMKSEKVTVVTFPPAYLALLDENEYAFLRCIITAGEAAHVDKAVACSQLVTYFNAYGPTECAVCVSIYQVTSADRNRRSIPIGRPIANLTVHILDENMNPVPLGLEGNIYVAGVGLARGYLNKPELTKERFVSHPFCPGQRLYYTGDKGRWLPEGNIEFLGRNDGQIKIRGHRVELGEIEGVLQKQSDLIVQGLVDVQTINSEATIVAYIIPTERFSIASLEHRLADYLPQYMLPAYFVTLEQFPLTNHGKVDKNALPAVQPLDGRRSSNVAPKDDLEVALATIFQEVLGIERVGVCDDFFQLGGHSLRVTQLVNKIRKALGYNINIKDVFLNPTIETLKNHCIRQEAYRPIEKAPQQKYYPLSSTQKRIWVLSQLEGGSLAYNMSATLVLQGRLHVAALEKAFRYAIEKHEILRTVFVTIEGMVRQMVVSVEQTDFRIVQYDLSTVQDPNHQVSELIGSIEARPFTIDRFPLIKAHLFKLAPSEHLFYISFHHLIGDGWSMEVLTSEVMSNYAALANGHEPDCDVLPIQFSDYAVWLEQQAQTLEWKKQQEYWAKVFDGPIPILSLFPYRSRPAIKTFHGAVLTYNISEEMLASIKLYSVRNKATLFMTLMAGLKVLLYRYTGQEDIIIGTPVANRDHADVEQQIGPYINTLAIRSKVQAHLGFDEALATEKEALIKAYAHQQLPFEKIIEHLDQRTDPSRSPLFDIMVVLQSQARTDIRKGTGLDGIVVSPWGWSVRVASQFDMTFNFVESDQGLDLDVEYNTDLLDATEINRLITDFKSLLLKAIQYPAHPVCTIDYISENEKYILDGFNDTKVDYPYNNSFLELFEEQVIRHPNHIAVVFEQKQLQYEQLDCVSNQFAHHLHKHYQVDNDSLIAILLDRSEWMTVVILGVMKAGAAYVPIERETPQERIQFILDDTDCKVLIDESLIATFINEQKKYPCTFPWKNRVQRNSLAYAIYTSGSTGKPKGVMVEHGSLLNHLLWKQDILALTARDTVLQKTSFGFDVSVWELLGPLVAGARSVFAKTDGQKDLNYLIEIIEKQGVTIVHFVPFMLGEFLRQMDEGQCRSLRHVLCSGEALKPAHVTLFKGKCKQAVLHNLYGPTEATIEVTHWSTLSPSSYDHIVPIGEPAANTRLYILDDQCNRVPRGVTGELHIGGCPVAAAYLKRPSLTA
ncbi:MAG: amino acid adenylation domain-containing protein [Ginsengibacter sp.]